MWEDADRIKHLALVPLTLHCDANLGQLYEYGAALPRAHFLPHRAKLIWIIPPIGDELHRNVFYMSFRRENWDASYGVFFYFSLRINLSSANVFVYDFLKLLWNYESLHDTVFSSSMRMKFTSFSYFMKNIFLCYKIFYEIEVS